MPTPQLPPLLSLDPHRVCLVKPSALGDVVQTLPVLAGLRARWPRAHLAWVVNRSLVGLLARHPQLDEVIPFDRAARGWRRARAALDLARTLRAGRFDLVIDLQGLLRSGLMARATSAPRRVGFATAREGASWCYTDRIQVPSEIVAAVPRYWYLAQALGCVGQPPRAQLGLSPADRAWARQELARLTGPRLAIHPGALWATKRWPVAQFAEVARQAMRARGAGVVLVGGPGEEDLCGDLARQLDPGNTVNLAGRTNLLQLAAVLAEADLVLANDSGPMHLAAAMETPVVALFTCTSPGRAGPHGTTHQTIATQVSCAASYRRTCPTCHCFGELSAARVWPAVDERLQAVEPSRQRAG